MKTFSEREQVRTVAQRWKTAYCQDGRWMSYPARDKRGRDKTHEMLLALDPDKATCADVASIIGNNSWVEPPTCHECGAQSWRCVELGQEPDYESATATICPDCLRKALELSEVSL